MKLLTVTHIDAQKNIESIWFVKPKEDISIGSNSADDIRIADESNSKSHITISAEKSKVFFEFKEVRQRSRLFNNEKIVFYIGLDKIEIKSGRPPAPKTLDQNGLLEEIFINPKKSIVGFQHKATEKSKILHSDNYTKLLEDENSYGLLDIFFETDRFQKFYVKTIKPSFSSAEYLTSYKSYNSVGSIGLLKEEPDRKFKVVDVFYSTDRNILNNGTDVEKFGSDRGGSVSFGVCQVSIPDAHKLGEIEAPKLWRLELKENPNKHIILLRTEIIDEEHYFNRISMEMESIKDKKAFLFIHGYNVSFSDAAKRTAQIHYDLKFTGLPFFFSWPSKGNEKDYTRDEQTIEWAKINILSFIEKLINVEKISKFYLIAHSMGNRALTQAIITLYQKYPDLREKLQEIILTAPDIDADIFMRDIAPEITQIGPPVTLYASSSDKALHLSKYVHGYKRAGDTAAGVVIYPGIETIDASVVNTSFLGHSYYGDEASVLSDMFYLITHNKRADERFQLIRVNTINGIYWEFKA